MIICIEALIKLKVILGCILKYLISRISEVKTQLFVMFIFIADYFKQYVFLKINRIGWDLPMTTALVEMKSQLFPQTPFDGSPQKYMSMKLSNPKYFCSQPKVKCSRDCFHLDPRGLSVSYVVTIFSHGFDCSTTFIHLNFHPLP